MFEKELKQRFRKKIDEAFGLEECQETEYEKKGPLRLV